MLQIDEAENTSTENAADVSSGLTTDVDPKFKLDPSAPRGKRGVSMEPPAEAPTSLAVDDETPAQEEPLVETGAAPPNPTMPTPANPTQTNTQDMLQGALRTVEEKKRPNQQRSDTTTPPDSGAAESGKAEEKSPDSESPEASATTSSAASTVPPSTKLPTSPPLAPLSPIKLPSNATQSSREWSSSSPSSARERGVSRARSKSRSKKRKKDKILKFTTVASGTLGLDEMRTHLDNSKVWYGIFRIAVGTGKFKRSKAVFLHFNGDGCKPVQRGKANGLLSNAKALFAANSIAGFNMVTLQMTDKSDCTVKNVFRELANVFVADNIQGQDINFFIEQYMRKQDIKKKIAEGEELTEEEQKDAVALELETEGFVAQEAVTTLDTDAPAETGEPTDDVKTSDADPSPVASPKPKPVDDGLTPKQRKLRKIMGKVCRKTGGVNWVMLRPRSGKEPILHAFHDAAGSTGLDELRGCLNDEKVLYGVLRLAFGQGKLRRNKLVFLHWCGMKTKRIKKGRHNAEEARVAEFCMPWNVKLQFTEKCQVTVRNVLKRVHDIVYVDKPETFNFDDELQFLEKLMRKSSQEDKRTSMLSREGTLIPLSELEGLDPSKIDETEILDADIIDSASTVASSTDVDTQEVDDASLDSLKKQIPEVDVNEPVLNLIKLVRSLDSPNDWAIFAPPGQEL